MKYFAILQELFESDSIIIFIVGLFIAVFISIKQERMRNTLLMSGISVVLYAICELLLNFYTNYLLTFPTLFIGTIAIGVFIGGLIGVVLKKIFKR